MLYVVFLGGEFSLRQLRGNTGMIEPGYHARHATIQSNAAEDQPRQFE